MDNNVQGRIDDYLDQVFGSYDDCATVAELRIEVRQNLIERLDDLSEQGVGDEVAYAQVISSVGDIESMIKEIAAQDRAVENAGEGQDYGSGVFLGDSNDVPREPEEQSFSEPVGDPGSIPGGEAPGQSWKPHSGRTPPSGIEGWVGFVIDTVNAGLDIARERVTEGLSQVDQALGSDGPLDKAFERESAQWEKRAEEWERRVASWEKRWTSGQSRVYYAGTDLRNADFQGRTLHNARFTASTMRGVNFTGALLDGAKLTASDLRGANFTGADLTGANLTSCNLREAIFERTNLTDARLATANMRRVYFSGANLTGTRATYADMRAVIFADSTMKSVDFTGSDLREARFDGLGLFDVNFTSSNLTNASFRGSTLRNVSFHHVSARVLSAIIFDDTVMDRSTYASLRASGCTPTGVRVED